MTGIRQATLTMASVVAGVCGVGLLTERVQDGHGGPSIELLEEMTDGYLLLDEAARIVEINKTARQILRIDEPLEGTAVTTVLPDVAPLLSESTQSRVELTVTTDQYRQYIAARHLELPPCDDSADQLIALRDTTERRRVEKRYQELIGNASDLVVVLDAEGTITFAGPSFERVLGHDPDDLVGTPMCSEIHPDDEACFQDTFETLLDSPEESHRFEYRVRTAGGEWRVLEGIGRNLLDNPDVRGIVVNSRDITARKKREHDLQRQNERLEEFARVVSHDLRNPLQIAKGYLGEAKHSGEEASFRKVEQAHDRIETLIEDVLTLARQGQNVGETSPTKLSEVARKAWNTVDTGDAQLALDGDATLDADGDRLCQLFENLFRNTVEHAATDTCSEPRGDTVEHTATSNRPRVGGPLERSDAAVTITVGPIEPMHTTTRIDREIQSGFFVADDGPGIPDEDKEQVLESGYTTAEDGTGFGLAIVEQIADAHGWDVTVTDSRNGGARFEFTNLPDDEKLQPD